MLIAPILIAMLNILVNHTMLIKKRSTVSSFIYYIINSIFVALLLNYLNSAVQDPIIYKYLTYLVAFSYIFYLVIVFEGSFAIKLFSMLSTWIFSTIIILSSSMIYGLIDGYNPSYHIINATSIVLHILLLIMFYQNYGEKFRRTLEKIDERIIYFMSAYIFIAFIFLINSHHGMERF